MLLQNQNSNSEDHKVMTLSELPAFVIVESGDVGYSSCAYSRFLSTCRLPSKLMCILCEDG